MISANSGEWQGLENLSAELQAELRRNGPKLVLDGALYLESELKRTLTGRRSGRQYQVSRTGRLHVASAPGEPPAVLFGHLRNSVGHTQPKWQGNVVSSEVGVGLGVRPSDGSVSPEAYAARLEYGGVHATTADRTVMVAPGTWRRVKAGTTIRILPRPYFAPTLLRAIPVIERMWEQGI